MPIELELELADWDAPIITDFDTLYTAANTSVSWRIQNCQIKCDMLSLDNSLDSSYENHVLEGNTLNIVYDTYVSAIQTIPSANTQVNVSRSLTSLRSVICSGSGSVSAGGITFGVESAIIGASQSASSNSNSIGIYRNGKYFA